MLCLVVLWQARQVSLESLLPATWHLVQFFRPSRSACDCASGPGENTSARAPAAASITAAARIRSAEPDIPEVHRDCDVRGNRDDQEASERCVEQAPAAEQFLQRLVEGDLDAEPGQLQVAVVELVVLAFLIEVKAGKEQAQANPGRADGPGHHHPEERTG